MSNIYNVITFALLKKSYFSVIIGSYDMPKHLKLNTMKVAQQTYLRLVGLSIPNNRNGVYFI